MVDSSSLSHDFYQVMVGSQSMSLLGWRVLAEWSIEFSCLDEEEMVATTEAWQRMWDRFCTWIVEEYGEAFEKSKGE